MRDAKLCDGVCLGWQQPTMQREAMTTQLHSQKMTTVGSQAVGPETDLMDREKLKWPLKTQ